jgi:hypothetical protein
LPDFLFTSAPSRGRVVQFFHFPYNNNKSRQQLSLTGHLYLHILRDSNYKRQ